MSIHRLQGLFRTAWPDERATGLQWYVQANDEVLRIADEFKLPPRTIAGILSALSPGTTWEQSLVDARHLLSVAELIGTGDDLFREATVTTYKSNLRKAIRILQDEDPQIVLNGPNSFKTPIFFRNLLGDWSEPTIDTHAINAWHGRRVAGSRLSFPREVSTKRKIRADYIRAAQSRDLTPAEYQAIVWVTWKRRIDQGLVPGYAKE